MTTQEFSNEFDILYNNVMSNQAPGLDEYEKSVFLTKAQDEILKNYFNPKGNKYQEGFDGNQKRQYDFSNLIRTASLFNINSVKKDRISGIEKLDRRSIPFVFPQDCFIAVNEVISDSTGNYYSVIPLTYDEYQRYMSKPYAYPTKRAAWRILTDKKNCNYHHEYVQDEEGNPTTVDYEFLSTWADQKRNLLIQIGSSISNVEGNTYPTIGPVVEDNECSEIIINYKSEEYEGNLSVLVDAGWIKSDDIFLPYYPEGTRPYYTYKVRVEVSFPYGTNEKLLSKKNIDDETIVDIIQKAFVAYSLLDNPPEGDFRKAYEHLDGFRNFTAPSKFYLFSDSTAASKNENMLLTHSVSLPIAEVVGKFKGDITYQMRYIKKPRPIILADLMDLSIKGFNTITECELPEEVHSEVLQRAVELAKAAYVGDLKSSVELGQRSE